MCCIIKTTVAIVMLLVVELVDVGVVVVGSVEMEMVVKVPIAAS